jgi:hypothetical protein
LKPIELPRIDNKEEFDKGVDLVASTKVLNLGFNLFNMNYDAAMESDYEHIKLFLQNFPAKGRKLLICFDASSEDKVVDFDNICEKFDEDVLKDLPAEDRMLFFLNVDKAE